MTAITGCTVGLSDSRYSICCPLNFKRILGWSKWTEVDQGTYNNIVSLLRVAKDYKLTGVFAPYSLAPKEYRRFGRFTEEEWDAGVIVPGTFTRVNGEEWDYNQCPGPTKTFCRYKETKQRGVCVEVVKIGNTITSFVDVYSGISGSIISVAMPNITVKFKHRATLASMPNQMS